MPPALDIQHKSSFTHSEEKGGEVLALEAKNATFCVCESFLHSDPICWRPLKFFCRKWVLSHIWGWGGIGNYPATLFSGSMTFNCSICRHVSIVQQGGGGGEGGVAQRSILDFMENVLRGCENETLASCKGRISI